jgi:flagellar protein FlbD
MINDFIKNIGGVMVEVVGINGESFLINAALIEKIEFIPETKITLTTGKYYLIKDTKDEIINKIIKYNQKIIRGVTAE